VELLQELVATLHLLHGLGIYDELFIVEDDILHLLIGQIIHSN
jgi:hypothetical protein